MLIDSNAPVGLGEPTVRMPNSLRLVLLLLPPLLLAGLEALHPQPEPTVQAMLDVATWFAIFHVIQLVLIGLVALSVLLLADTFGRANAWATRLGLGTLSGLLQRVRHPRRDRHRTRYAGSPGPVPHPAGRCPGRCPGLAGPGAALRTQHPGNCRVGDRRRGARAWPPTARARPRRVWIPLGLAALFLLGGHPFPAGTLAFGSFFLAALLVEWDSRLGRDTNRRLRRAPNKFRCRSAPHGFSISLGSELSGYPVVDHWFLGAVDRSGWSPFW